MNRVGTSKKLVEIKAIGSIAPNWRKVCREVKPTARWIAPVGEGCEGCD